LREAFRFGLPGWIGNVFQQVNYRFDVIILAAYASTADVGVYSVALTITSLAWVLPHGLQTVIFPRTANLDAAAEAGELSAEESDAVYFWLIPAFDEWGAAVASSISYLATAVITAGFFRRVLGISLTTALIPTAADLRNYPEALAAFRAHVRTRRARGQAA
jgi:hypothetical protein